MQTAAAWRCMRKNCSNQKAPHREISCRQRRGLPFFFFRPLISELLVILEELQKSLLNSSFSWRSERCSFFIPMM
jgi:hypothetical protein